MLLNHHITVKDKNNLHLDIHTIGYPDEGESILTLLCDGDKVLFSVLTDCYEFKRYNYASRLLERLNVNQIDAFIWTHPDEDHSVGIPDFLDKFDSHHKAEIFLPVTLNKKMKGLGLKAKRALCYVTKYYNSHRKYDVNYVHLHKDEIQRPLLNLTIEVMNPRTTIKYSHNFILPNDNVIHRSLDSDAKTHLNNLSIVYFVSFNDFSFFFCGDLSKRNVRFIDLDLYENSVFIKIPHHGSDDLNNLVPKFKNQSVKHAISTTTVFKRHNLPKDKVLEKYKTISDGIYCTSNIYEEQSERYGCITAIFYAKNMDKPEVLTSGNAYCYHQA